MLLYVGATMIHVYAFADSSHAAADSSFASRRELCFTLEGDIFVRYQSYQVGHTLSMAITHRVTLLGETVLPVTAGTVQPGNTSSSRCRRHAHGNIVEHCKLAAACSAFLQLFALLCVQE